MASNVELIVDILDENDISPESQIPFKNGLSVLDVAIEMLKEDDLLEEVAENVDSIEAKEAAAEFSWRVC